MSGKGPPPSYPSREGGGTAFAAGTSRWNSNRAPAPLQSAPSAGPSTATSHHKAEDAQPNEQVASNRFHAPPQLMTAAAAMTATTTTTKRVTAPASRAQAAYQSRNSKLSIQRPRPDGRPPTTSGGWSDSPRRSSSTSHNDRTLHIGKGKGKEKAQSTWHRAAPHFQSARAQMPR